MRNLLTPTAALLALCLSGCTPPSPNTAASASAPAVPAARDAPADIDQARICETSLYGQVPKDCKPGMKIAFLPKTFGNAQLPLLFVALQCDLRYSVALTEGGAVCILRPVTMAADASPASAPAAASAPAEPASSAASR